MEQDDNALSSAQFEDEDSLNLLACRELIEMVKSNEFLWKKRLTSFKDQQMKNLCWTSIGSALTSELSGADAEKEFYRLRQKFGREARKEKESAPRSGAGAGEPLYISEWPLYKDLEFLKDVIKPRRTISNFSKSSSQKLSSPSPPMCNFTKTAMEHQRPNPTSSPPMCNFTKTAMEHQRPSPISSPPIIIENSPSSSLWNSDLECSILSGSDRDSMSPGPSSVVSLKRSVPAPDANYIKKKKYICGRILIIKKKKAQDDMVNVMNKHAANMNVLTDTVKHYFKNPSQNPGSPMMQQNSEDFLFLTISTALAGMLQENRLSCIIELVQVVQKYTEK